LATQQLKFFDKNTAAIVFKMPTLRLIFITSQLHYPSCSGEIQPIMNLLSDAMRTYEMANVCTSHFLIAATLIPSVLGN